MYAAWRRSSQNEKKENTGNALYTAAGGRTEPGEIQKPLPQRVSQYRVHTDYSGGCFNPGGHLMAPGFADGEIIFSVKTSEFEPGEIVAFYYNNKILVKRVICGPGDWIDIDEDGTVYVNEVRLEEPYLTEKALGDCNIDLPFQVPDGKVFVMGDHRSPPSGLEESGKRAGLHRGVLHDVCPDFTCYYLGNWKKFSVLTGNLGCSCPYGWLL